MVLIVEDDPVTLRSYQHSVERGAGMSALTATTAAEARSLASRHQPDACILDFQLPGGETGLQLLPDLRGRHPEMLLVFVTGYGSLELGADAKAAGADFVLSKPVTYAEIVRRIGQPCATPANADEVTASDDRARWEHMHRVLKDCGGNRSEAARRLGVDRGTLQRWLDRVAPR
jgi:two-component system response regulator RegA